MSVQKTLELVKQAQQKASDEIAKVAGFLQSASATSGLTFYDLEAPAKTLYPVLTPLRNEIPRVKARGGTQANWRAITGINTTNVRPGVSEANRGGATTHTTADYLAAFRGFGLEDFVSFEADYAAENFDDAKARATEGLLRSTMIAEESVILGGDTSVSLGTTPTPTLAQNTDSTSTVTNGTLSVICVALGFNAYWSLNGYNNGATGQSLAIASADPNAQAVITRTNMDGTSDTFGGGVAKKSVAATVTIDGTHKSAAGTVTAVAGAFGYAWYWGVAGAEALGAVTTINSVQITANAAGAALASGANLATDNSTSSLECDGLLYQIVKAASGAYVLAQPTGTAGTGTKLTSNGAGGITELDTMFQDRWNLYRLSIDELWANSQEMININNIVVKNGGAPLIRFSMDGGGQLEAGVVVGSLLNRITNTKVQLRIHPNMPAGALMGRCKQLPYKLSGVNDVVRMLLRQDYYQIEWPRVKRRYEYGVYFDGVLQNYFPPAYTLLYNIGNGS